jgi:hypothetical protein
MLTSYRVRLPDLKFVIDEFAALERKPGSGGHDRIDARGHEDAANVCAGAIAQFAAAEPSSAENWIEYYRRLNEPGGYNEPSKPEFGYELAPEAKKAFRVRVPTNVSTLLLSDGRTVHVDGDRIVEVPETDAIAYGMNGWERLNV